MKRLFAVFTASMVVLCAGIIWASSAQADEYEGVTYTSNACGVVDVMNGRDNDIFVEFQGNETLLPSGDTMSLSAVGQKDLTFTLFVDRGVFSTITYTTPCAEPEPTKPPVHKPKPKPKDKKPAATTYAAPKTGEAGDTATAPLVPLMGGAGVLLALGGVAAWRRRGRV